MEAPGTAMQGTPFSSRRAAAGVLGSASLLESASGLAGAGELLGFLSGIGRLILMHTRRGGATTILRQAT